MSGAAPVALVTGASRGTGLEVARQLAAEGYRVVAGARDLGKGAAAAAMRARRASTWWRGRST